MPSALPAALPPPPPPPSLPPAPEPAPTGLVGALALAAPVALGESLGTSLEQLRAQRDAAKGADRALLDRMVRLTERMRKVGSDVAAIKRDGASWLNDYAAICRDIAKSAPDDAAVQSQIASTLFSIPALATSMGLDAKPFEGLRSEATKMLEGALKRLNDARVYAANASVCQANGDAPLACMRLLAKCTTLEPKVPRCATELEKMKADYVRPHCTGADIDAGLAFFAAHPDPKVPYGKPLPESKPAFVAQDFALLQEVEQRYTTQEWDDTKQAFGPLIEKRERALSILMAPGKADELARWSEALASEKGSVIVRVGVTDLVTARVVSRVEKSLTLSGAIDKVCTKTSKRELPEDLATAR